MCDFKKLRMLQKYSGFVRNSTALKICEKWIIEQLATGLSYNEVTNLFYVLLEENGIKVDKRVPNSIYFYIKRYNLNSKIEELKKEIREKKMKLIPNKKDEIVEEKKEFRIFKNV